MKIIECECGDFENGWNFSKIQLDSFNLFVGASGAGKSKLLNWIFDIGNKAANDKPAIFQGYWRLVYEHEDRTFLWEYEAKPGPQVAPNSITKEIVSEITDESPKVLIERDRSDIIFNGIALPKLSSTASALYTLQEDPAVIAAFDGFRRIMRRNFYADELGMAGAFQEVPANTQDVFKNTKSLEQIWGQHLSLGVRLSLLKQVLPEKYKEIVEYYKSVFPFIKHCDVLDLSQLKGPDLPVKTPGGRAMPVFVIYENRANRPIPYHRMSSGLQKVLLIITDIVMLPGGTVYLLDEYENSLGVNAINFLPTFLLDQQHDNQVVITSHHPYLINAIDAKNWFVFHRTGTKVTIKPGIELQEKYGRSRQALFTQLLNDPFYSEGVE